MNQINISGRLTKDAELRYTNSNIPVASFTLAVDRPFKRDETDFINCVAWKNTGENIHKYFHKGDYVIVQGSLQIRTYEDNDQKKHYVTEVVVDRFDFVPQPKAEQPNEIPNDLKVEDDLPF